MTDMARALPHPANDCDAAVPVRWVLRGGRGQPAGWEATGKRDRRDASLRLTNSAASRGVLAGSPCLIVFGVA
ncbi:hypothetical protein [Stakelama tenebrarum]|uniref:Uncharacterized protein n=1 Tax=Stakelama tenebrarum TaxID=2711215 RepID=A0A6G6Y447_9SPHN|nr:hypothetical protein [Sphingosinithalassobacter tenebrarum]QIG79685.1 hypothetical protein G5C33_07690 [Sphingosinithalassobacter tenebrarum]